MLEWLRRRLLKPRGKGARAAFAAALQSSSSSQHTGPGESVASGPLQLYDAGRRDEAGKAAEALLQRDPGNAEAQAVCGHIAVDRGRAMDALRIIRQALQSHPNHFDLLIALGRACRAARRPQDALAAFERALKIRPASGAPYLHLGIMALQRSDTSHALRQFTTAVQNDPALAEAHFHLANLVRAQGRLQDAERHYRDAIAARPDFDDALCNLGGLLNDRGNYLEAGPFLEQALRLNPQLSMASFNLAMVRINERRWQESIALLRNSIAAGAGDADAYYWLGNALTGVGDVAAARDAYQSAIRLDRNHVKARWCYAIAQIPAIPRDDNEQSAAAAAYHRETTRLATWLRTQRPADGFQAVASQQPFYLAYIPQNHRDVLLQYGTACSALMADWGKKAGIPAVSGARGTQCRVGIVSSHVHSHSVWHAITSGWIANVDAARIELHLFHTGRVRDSETEAAARRVNRLHFGLGGWQDWARALSAGRFDALIYPDLGMDDSTSMRLASLRLARVQLASWGHPITTGLPTIDAFVSAEALEPDDASSHYTEMLLRLPGLGCCYEPYEITPRMPDLSAWDIGQNERLLVCAGTPFKYSPQDDRVYVEIARACRPCKLVFFCAASGELSALLEQRLRNAFDSAGVRFDDCVRFIPWQSHAEFFGLLRRADVYLDTIGFSGFNTAMQALECCTPVVAWEGAFMRGRFASGILRKAGLDQWIATRHEDYVELVRRLCADSALRASVRADIATRVPCLFGDRETARALWKEVEKLA